MGILTRLPAPFQLQCIWECDEQVCWHAVLKFTDIGTSQYWGRGHPPPHPTSPAFLPGSAQHSSFLQTCPASTFLVQETAAFDLLLAARAQFSSRALKGGGTHACRAAKFHEHWRDSGRWQHNKCIDTVTLTVPPKLKSFVTKWQAVYPPLLF